jgi:hypothetical protein
MFLSKYLQKSIILLKKWAASATRVLDMAVQPPQSLENVNSAVWLNYKLP